MSGHAIPAPPRETVSVIMPNYNCARYVAEAIDSVLGQTLPPLELIVIDDGSSDGSLEVIERYRDTVTLIPLPHTGKPGLVRNRGLSVARGHLIAFLDADDVWLPEKLAIQIAYLVDRPDVDLVHSNLQVIDAGGRYLRDIFFGCPGSQGLTDDHPESSFLQLVNGDSNVWTSAVLVRRGCLERAGGFDQRLAVGEDYHLWIRIARSSRIGYIPTPLAKHRKHGANTGTSCPHLCPPQEVRLWQHILELYPELLHTHGPVIHAKSLFHYVVNAVRCARDGRYWTAARLVTAGLATHLGKTRYRHLKRTALKYLMIRRLQQERLALGGRAR